VNIKNNAANLKPRVFPKPEAPAKGTGYIIMPPQDDNLFKSGVETPNLDTFGVVKKEELSILGGYLAELTDAQVKELEKKGYSVFKDEVHQYLPNNAPVDLNAVAISAYTEATSKKAGKKEEEVADAPDADQPAPPAEDPYQGRSNFVPRKELEAPRFNSPIEQAARGKGVTIAVLDSGVAPHPDFGNRLLGQIDFINGRSLPYDDNGHGTHVAGCAAGNGSIDARYAGPASEANILSMKVLSGSGSGATSGIVKAIQTAVQMKEDLNIRVINMSLGGPASKNGEKDPINMAIKAAKEAGITVVVAAGNEGPEPKTVGSPGNSLNAITVGALDDKNTPDRSDDVPASFSSRGPTPDGDIKPDVMAPGVSIMAPLSMQSEVFERAESSAAVHKVIQALDNMPFAVLQQQPNELFAAAGIGPATAEKIKLKEEISDVIFTKLLEATSRTPLEETGAYVGLPGTSMATPIVAGVAAAMIGANPNLTPDHVQNILMETAEKLPDGRLGPNTQGAGAINAKNAILTAMQTEVEAPPAPSEEELLAKALKELGVDLADIEIVGEEPTESDKPAEEPAPEAPKTEAPKAAKPKKPKKSKGVA
jgi:subtilisin family serine protease